MVAGAKGCEARAAAAAAEKKNIAYRQPRSLDSPALKAFADFTL